MVRAIAPRLHAELVLVQSRSMVGCDGVDAIASMVVEIL